MRKATNLAKSLKEVSEMRKATNLAESLKEVRECLQQNSDAMSALIEEREIICYASASEKDIKERLDKIVARAADAYLEDSKHKLIRLTAPPAAGDISDINLFEQTVVLDGVSYRALNPNAIAFYFKDILFERNKELAAKAVKPDAGLPAYERALKINKLDAEIIKHEKELEKLKQQAADAGLIISETTVAQPVQ